MTISEPLTDIFGDATDILAVQCTRWMEESPRFRDFVAAYRTKIRKKVRGLRDEEGRGDLLFELATAHRLLQERRFTIEYEKYGVGKQRTPDFVVTYKTNVVFNVEVKRMRAAPVVSTLPAPQEADVPRAEELRDSNKLINTICAKLGQLLPGTINLLALSADGLVYAEEGIAQTMKLLQQHADHKDEEYFVRRGFASARDFLHDYQRLSAVLVRRGWDDDGAPMALWLNKQAQRPVPNDLYAILRR
jgi:hypothetical protein